MRHTRPHLLLAAACLALSGCGGCRTASEPGGAQQGNDLENMDTIRISASDQEFEVWVAQTDQQRLKGLMFVEDPLQPLADGTPRGMLFAFDNESTLAFWMKNTFIPLDIAYAAGDGTIVKIYTMQPLDTSLYPSIQRARYALEVNAGVFAELGISEGDTLVIPN